MKYSLAERYVLEKLHRGRNLKILDKREINYDVDYMTFVKQVESLSEENKVLFISDVEKYVDNLIWEKKDKLFFLLIIIFSSLHHFFDITKEPILSKVISIAKRLVEEFLEPWFIKDIVKRHSYIDIDNIESWEVKILEKPKPILSKDFKEN